MKLTKDTLCHIVDGYKVYLDRSNHPNMEQYKHTVRHAYGNLNGIKFELLPAGTELVSGNWPHNYWWRKK